MKTPSKERQKSYDAGVWRNPVTRARKEARHKKWVENNRERDREHGKADRKKRRLLCLQFYSGAIPSCACCGETIYQFLAIDHMNGGGNKHRKSLKSMDIYRWLVKNNFPLGFQVLCHNCNLAKGYYGICPHTALTDEPSVVV